LSSSYSWNQDKTFFQGVPFHSINRNTMGRLSVMGMTATGTTYDLSTAYMRNYGEYEALMEGSVFSGTSIQDEFRSSVTGSVTQQLLRGYRFAYNMQPVLIAQNAMSQAELRYQDVRQTVLSSTSQAYWGWVYAEALLAIRLASVEVSAEALRIGRLRFEAKELAAMEVTRLEAAWIQDQATELDAQSSAQLAQSTLLLAMGRAPMADIQPAALDLTVEALSLSMTEATEVALTNSLGLALSKAAVEQAELNARMARHALLPSLSATLSAGMGAQGANAGTALGGVFKEGNFPQMSVQGQFSMPLGNRFARSERMRSEAALASQRVALIEQERQLVANVSQQVLLLN
jgi:outer membrane protein TolC